MDNREAPEAFQTATVFRRIDAQTGTVVFNSDFSELFGAYDKFLPYVYDWSLRQDVTHFLWAQPKGYRRPPNAVADPTCPGVRIPGTPFGISTMRFLLCFGKDDTVKHIEPHDLSRNQLTQLVNAMNRLCRQ